MPRVPHLVTGLCITLCLAVPSLFAQQTEIVSKTVAATPVVTALASQGLVRFTAPSNVTRMRLEVFSPTGEKTIETEIKGGNILDWVLPETNSQLSDGSYVCLITIKSLSGRLSQRTALLNFNQGKTELVQAEPTKLSAVQVQAIGPMEDDSSLKILAADEVNALTVIGHDGENGQVSRGRGALSFRLGDFFAGKDQEQMRLTAEGNLGLGTDKPLAKLDVAGTIRAREGLEFNNGTRLSTSEKGGLEQTLPDGTVVTNTTGTGTQDHIARWIDNSGTLGDSVIFENASTNIGVGTTTPGAKFHVVGIQGSKAGGTFQLDTSTPFASFTGAYPAFEILNANPTNNNVSLFQFSDAPTGASHAGIGAVSTNHVSKFGNLFFFTKQSDGYQVRMGVFGTNVGIGTTTPAFPLTVNGIINSTSGGFRFPDGSTQTTAGVGFSVPFSQTASTSSTLFALTQLGTGKTATFAINNTGSTDRALEATTNGSNSSAARFVNTNSINSSPALQVTSNSTIGAADFTNTSANGSGVTITTTGLSGTPLTATAQANGIGIVTSGGGFGIQASSTSSNNTSGDSAYAGSFTGVGGLGKGVLIAAAAGNPALKMNLGRLVLSSGTVNGGGTIPNDAIVVEVQDDLAATTPQVALPTSIPPPDSAMNIGTIIFVHSKDPQGATITGVFGGTVTITNTVVRYFIRVPDPTGATTGVWKREQP